VCYSGGPLLRKCLLRLLGLAPLFCKRRFNGSQLSLQVLYSRLCCGSFALFLLERGVRRLFGSALLFGKVACGGWFLTGRLRVRRRGCYSLILAVCFCVHQTL
jgi:hypothetical protein